MEDLEDVNLRVPLVAKNPRAWALPKRLREAWEDRIEEAPEQVILDWWLDLCEKDQRIHETFGPERRARLKSLVQDFDAIWADYTDTTSDQQRLKRVLYGMISQDLGTEQIANMVGIPQTRLVRLLLSNVKMTSDDVRARIEAERLLRLGVTHGEVAESTGIAKYQVQQWAKTLRIKPPTTRYSAGYNADARAKAYDLYDEGMSVSDILHTLQSEYPERTFKKMTVYKWINRRKLANNARD